MRRLRCITASAYPSLRFVLEVAVGCTWDVVGCNSLDAIWIMKLLANNYIARHRTTKAESELLATNWDIAMYELHAIVFIGLLFTRCSSKFAVTRPFLFPMPLTSVRSTMTHPFYFLTIDDQQRLRKCLTGSNTLFRPVFQRDRMTWEPLK